MKDAVVQFKTSSKLKKQAMELAEDLGIDITSVLNLYLGQFVRDKVIHVSLSHSHMDDDMDIFEELKSRVRDPKMISSEEMKSFINQMNE